MKRKEAFDEADLKVNPFLYGLKIPVTKHVNGKLLKEKDGMWLPSTYLSERQASTKVFHSEDHLKAVASLTEKSNRLYTYIVLTLLPGKDYIQINEQRYMGLFKVKSLTTYRDAIRELVDYAFIARTNFKTVFWINPALIFCGSRPDKYPDKIVIKSTFEH